MSLVFPMVDLSQVGEARRTALAMCESFASFGDVRRGRVGIIINELGNNLVRYAKDGRLILRAFDSGIEVLSIDHGPGLDVSKVMQDGFTTGATPGTGLGAVRRLADVFDIFSMTDAGTAIVAQIFANDGVARMTRYEVGVVNVPLARETVCGDSWCAIENDEELDVLMVDGLGHGPLAYRAAQEGVDVFRLAGRAAVDQTLQLIHGRMKSTRGGAVFLLKVTPRGVDFAGLGNIRVAIHNLGKTRILMSQNGTAGVQMRSVKVLTEPWDGGLLLLHSDGLGSRWDLTKYPGLNSRHPSIVAAILFRDFSRGNDDTTVVVVRRKA